jgi:hypothetical protein
VKFGTTLPERAERDGKAGVFGLTERVHFL